MKEAAGEANLTVVAIILIAVVVAVATPLVNSMMKSSGKRSCCTDAGAVWNGGTCKWASSTPASEQQSISTAYTTCCNDANVDGCDAISQTQGK